MSKGIEEAAKEDVGKTGTLEEEKWRGDDNEVKETKKEEVKEIVNPEQLKEERWKGDG